MFEAVVVVHMQPLHLEVGAGALGIQENPQLPSKFASLSKRHHLEQNTDGIREELGGRGSVTQHLPNAYKTEFRL